MMSVSTDAKDWTVLIVDDEPDNLGVARKVLTFSGSTVHVARNGVEGLSMLDSFIPTFILLDLSMPEMDGWEMLKAIRNDTMWADVPVIALTAHVMTGDKERVLQAGFNGYISKPFRINSFLEEIQSCLKSL
jgi:CheY-like chemotaxis protein